MTRATSPEDLGPDVAEILGLVERCREGLSHVRHLTASAGSDQLVDLLSGLGELILHAEAAEVAVVSDAISRGLPTTGTDALNTADWIAHYSRRHTPASGSRLAEVAKALCPASVTRPADVLAAGQDGHPLGEALLCGRVPVACAALAVTEMHRLRPDLTDEFIPAAWDSYTQIAAGGDPRTVRQLRLALYARYGRPDRLNTRDEVAHSQAHLSTGAVDPVDGMTAYRMLLDPESAAILEAALDPLSAPAPGPDNHPDQRPHGTRRAHALLDLIGRAVRAGDHIPTQPATQLSLTVALADLKTPTGCATTIGRADAGRYLAIATTRLLTCHTELHPVVLDDTGRPLLIGRSRRLFTRAQVRALHHRDQGCTFPHCTRPAGWSDAHHLIHWADGGRTDLDNAALLCPHHHHIVHTRRLAGHITTDPDHPDADHPDPGDTRPHDGGHDPMPDPGPGSRPPPRGQPRVRWDLTPGSYDAQLARRSATAA